jgi:hypothetical protein
MIVCVYNIPLQHSLTVGSFFQTTMKPTVVSIRNRHPVTKNETCSCEDTFLYVYLCGIRYLYVLLEVADLGFQGAGRPPTTVPSSSKALLRPWSSVRRSADLRGAQSFGITWSSTWCDLTIPWKTYGKPMQNRGKLNKKDLVIWCYMWWNLPETTIFGDEYDHPSMVILVMSYNWVYRVIFDVLWLLCI